MQNAHVIASVTLLSKYYILGMEKGELRTEELGTEELDAQHYAPCTWNCMYVCMYFIACYYELLMLILYEL